jgi:hypothetical protein
MERSTKTVGRPEDGTSVHSSEVSIPEGFELVTDSPSVPEGFELESNPKNPTISAWNEALKTTEDIGLVYPVLDAGASLATQGYAIPISGLIGALPALLGADAEVAKQVQEEVAGALTYQPQTQRGQELLQTASYPFEKLHEISQGGGDWVLEKTGSPVLATIAATGIEGLPAIIGARHMLKQAKAARAYSAPKVPDKLTPESQFYKEQFDKTFLEEQGISVVEMETKNSSGKVSLTPEESFILRSQGPDGLKAAAEVRKSNPETTLHGGIPIEQLGEAWKNTVGTFVWDNLIETKLPKVLERIPGGKSVNRAFLYDYRGELPDTPLYMESLESMKRHQAIGRVYAIDLGNRLITIPERSQLAIGDYLRGNKKVKLSNAEKMLATEARNTLDVLGKQAVDVGLLDEKVFFENVGQYLPRLYTSKEYQTQLVRYGLKKPNRFEMSRFMKRKDIPPEVRKQLGEITKPGYPVAKGITQITHDIEMAKHFNGIAANPKWSLIREPVVDAQGRKVPFKKPDTYNPITGEKIPGEKGIRMDFLRDPPPDWVRLPKNKRLGKLSDSYVHPEIAADILETIKTRSRGEKIWRSALGSWKFGKVILSPKTHVRNIMSNSLLGHLGGMPMWRQPGLLRKAAIEMRKNGNHWKNATQEGLLDSTWTEGELMDLFEKAGGRLKGNSASSMAENAGIIGQVWDKAKVAGDKAAKLYNAEEQWFKMAKYIDNVERRKMSTKAAAADAEKWLFNYSKLTKAQEAYRTKWYGAPFATFTIKSIPRIAEAAIKTPWRFGLPAAVILGMEEAARRQFGDTREQARAKSNLRPEWMQGGVGLPNFPRVPIQDDSGREYYLNLSYIVPWGDIAETGGIGPIPGGLMPLSQPFSKEAWQQLASWNGFSGPGGYDSFWKEPIVKESDVGGLPAGEKFKVATGKRLRHIYNTMVPTLAIDIEKGIDALSGNPDFRGRERPSGVVASDVFVGLKMYPVDYAEQVDRARGKLDPTSGRIARDIMAEIRSFAARRNHFATKGDDRRVKELDRKIADKVKQFHGLGAELQEFGKNYQVIHPPKGFILEKEK